MQSDHPHDPAELERLGGQFSELASLLTHDTEGTLAPTRVVDLASRAIPHARHSGLTLIRAGREPETLAASDDLSIRVDRLQYACGEGPCLDAAEADEVVVAEDLTVDGRWPVFAPRCAAETGVHSMLGARLPLGGHDLAALNFYAPGTGEFDDADVAIASIFAPFAALAVQQTLHDRDVADLATALTNSRQIGTAVGILMSRDKVTAETAFERLRAASQDLNRKLRDIAVEVEETGELPTPPHRDDRAARDRA